MLREVSLHKNMELLRHVKSLFLSKSTERLKALQNELLLKVKSFPVISQAGLYDKLAEGKLHRLFSAESFIPSEAKEKCIDTTLIAVRYVFFHFLCVFLKNKLHIVCLCFYTLKLIYSIS